MATDEYDEVVKITDEMLGHARRRGAALTVATVSALRALVGVRSGNLDAAEADAQTALQLAPDLLGTEFVVFAASAAVLAGLERDEPPEALRRLIDGTTARYDGEFSPGSQLRYASGVLRAAAGNHEAAIDELRSCALEHPIFGGENPTVLAWRSAAALSLAELGRHDEARALAADELRRAQAFGAPRAIGIALRVHALVGPPGAAGEAVQFGARCAGAVVRAARARPGTGRPRCNLPGPREAHRSPGAAARSAPVGGPLRCSDA